MLHKLKLKNGVQHWSTNFDISVHLEMIFCSYIF